MFVGPSVQQRPEVGVAVVAVRPILARIGDPLPRLIRHCTWTSTVLSKEVPDATPPAPRNGRLRRRSCQTHGSLTRPEGRHRLPVTSMCGDARALPIKEPPNDHFPRRARRHCIRSPADSCRPGRRPWPRRANRAANPHGDRLHLPHHLRAGRGVRGQHQGICLLADGNPTVRALEAAIAAIEGTDDAVAFGSGHGGDPRHRHHAREVRRHRSSRPAMSTAPPSLSSAATWPIPGSNTVFADATDTAASSAVIADVAAGARPCRSDLQSADPGCGCPGDCRMPAAGGCAPRAGQHVCDAGGDPWRPDSGPMPWCTRAPSISAAMATPPVASLPPRRDGHRRSGNQTN